MGDEEPVSDIDPAAAAVALELPAAAARVLAVVGPITRRQRGAAGIAARARPIVRVDFGRHMARRQAEVGAPGRWAATFARRFVYGSLRPEPITMTLSPYLPAQQQLRSSRG